MLLTTSSVLIGTRHGFSTRRGGVSTGRYATLNVGGKWGDEPEHVAHNRRRLAAAGGFDLVAPVHVAKQVHGAHVRSSSRARCPSASPRRGRRRGARVPGAVVGVYTADCVPILLGDGEGRVAAVHAGWRGTVAGVATAAVEALVSIGARARAAAGGARAVDLRPLLRGRRRGGRGVRGAGAVVGGARRGKKPHVDLWEANRAVLAAAGVPELDRRRAAVHHVRARALLQLSSRRRWIGQQLSFIVAG